MSYESIDESKLKDTFDEIKSRIISLKKELSPEIKERLEIEKKIKAYLKVSNPELVLNFILECIDNEGNK